MQDLPINTKTRVAYRNYMPARIVDTRKKGRKLQYRITWTNFNHRGKRNDFKKWVNASECKQVILPPNKIQKVLYYLIKLFNFKKK